MVEKHPSAEDTQVIDTKVLKISQQGEVETTLTELKSAFVEEVRSLQDYIISLDDVA